MVELKGFDPLLRCLQIRGRNGSSNKLAKFGRDNLAWIVSRCKSVAMGFGVKTSVNWPQVYDDACFREDTSLKSAVVYPDLEHGAGSDQAIREHGRLDRYLR